MIEPRSCSWGLCVLLVALLLVFCGGCGSATWKIEDVESLEVEKEWAALGQTTPLPKFVVIADTQYSIPGTDYDLKIRIGGRDLDIAPSLSTRASSSFYRHSAANHVLPKAIEHVIVQAHAQGMKFGILAGDLVEFACKDEADAIFRALEAHPYFPFMIVLGNHDVLFHGSYDPDAFTKARRSVWDQYILGTWQHVCRHHGGPLTKLDFLERVVRYYAIAWGATLRESESESETWTCPPGPPGGPAPNCEGWTLEYDLELGDGDFAHAHRSSHLWQRFSYLAPGAVGPATTFTVLDSTDYASRRALCDWRSMLLQLGMSGALSDDQILWLEQRGQVNGQHFVVSHYLPFRGIGKKDDCDLTAGTRCSWTNRVTRRFRENTVFIYAHVHQPFTYQTLTHTDDDGRSPLQLVRIPSLIDNHEYVEFSGTRFTGRELESMRGFESEAPFTATSSTCIQRYREYVELKRNLACYAEAKGRKSTFARCEPLAKAHAREQREAEALCSDATGQRYKAIHRETAMALEKLCSRWEPNQRWRCAVRELGRSVLHHALKPEEQLDFAGAQLGVTKTRTSQSRSFCLPPRDERLTRTPLPIRREQEWMCLMRELAAAFPEP